MELKGPLAAGKGHRKGGVQLEGIKRDGILAPSQKYKKLTFVDIHPYPQVAIDAWQMMAPRVYIGRSDVTLICAYDTISMLWGKMCKTVKVGNR